MAKAAVKPKATAPAKNPHLVEFFDVEQNTDEWLELRRGMITASNFKVVMREGKDGGESATRRDLLYRLAGEILSGEVAESFRSEAMKRGNAMEQDARAQYARTNLAANVQRVGFAKRTIPGQFSTLVVGASPDAQVGPRRGLEIKTMAPHLMIALAERGTPPSEHRAQVHGTMWVTGWYEVDLMFFYRGMPIAPKFRFERDEAYIKQISDEVERFDYELQQLVKKIRSMGGAR